MPDWTATDGHKLLGPYCASLFLLLSAAAAMGQGGPAAATTAPAGADLLGAAKWAYSSDGGRTFADTPPGVAPGGKADIVAKAEFDAKTVEGAVAMELTHAVPFGWDKQLAIKLNGSPLNGPQKEMYYNTLRALDPKLLKPGKNVLELELTGKPSTADVAALPRTTLFSLRAGDLRIITGPALGPFGSDRCTLMLRTNLPATATLQLKDAPAGAKPIQLQSPQGMVHRFTIKDLPARKFTLDLQVSRGDTVITTDVPVSLPAEGDRRRFVMVGDPQGGAGWPAIAAQIARQRPDFQVILGDLVSEGNVEIAWDKGFFAPAGDLFKTVPLFMTLGNHDRNAPVMEDFFFMPGQEKVCKTNWTQTFPGGVQIIGIYTQKELPKDGPDWKWLEDQLSKSKARFLIVCGHIPAWASCTFCQPVPANNKYPKTIAQLRDVMDLMAKYKATAYVCGHQHSYERSELPSGLSHISCGGANGDATGSLFEKSSDAEKQNPYSVKFLRKSHYCFFEVDGDTCTMRTLSATGEELDRRQFKARSD